MDLNKEKMKELIHYIISKYNGQTNLWRTSPDEISEYSHWDMPWIVAENHEILDYRYVFYRSDKYSVGEYNESDL